MNFEQWWGGYKEQSGIEEYVRMLIPMEECARAAWEAAEAQYKPLHDTYIIRHGDMAKVK